MAKIHVWLEEMVREERNGKEKRGEKTRNQSHFHCLVRHLINLFSLISFPSPPLLSSPYISSN